MYCSVDTILSFCMCICKWYVMLIIKYVTTMYRAVNAMYSTVNAMYVWHLSNIAKKHSNDSSVTDMYQICDILVNSSVAVSNIDL